jgi:hypothetical protein
MSFPPQTLQRRLSGATSTLDGMKKYLRGVYETESDVHKQCKAVIGGSDHTTICWLCGYKINSINNMSESEDRIVNVPKSGKMFDNATCEHVLPIKLAYTLATLYQKEGLVVPPVNFNDLLHTEYEYAHNLCNYAKNDNYFITWKDYTEGRDFCSLDINELKITEFLDYLLKYKQEGYTRNSVITLKFPGNFWPSQPSSFTEKVDNLVIANLIIEAYEKGIDWFASDENKQIIIDDWKYRMNRYIQEKMIDTIQYIKEADGCGTNTLGKYSSTINQRMKGAKVASTKQPAETIQSYPGFAQDLMYGTDTLMDFGKLRNAETGLVKLSDSMNNGSNEANAATGLLALRPRPTGGSGAPSSHMMANEGNNNLGGGKRKHTRRRKINKRKSKKRTRK